MYVDIVLLSTPRHEINMFTDLKKMDFYDINFCGIVQWFFRKSVYLNIEF